MLELNHITNRYANELYLNDIHVTIEKGTLYGIAGTDREGKAALLRTIAGISRPDIGEARLDGEPIYENPEAKKRIFFMSRIMYMRPWSMLADTARFYSGYYPNWSGDTFLQLADVFSLKTDQRTVTMTEEELQLAKVAIGLSAGTDCLLMEKPFHDLDDERIEMIIKLLHSYIEKREAIVILTAKHIHEKNYTRYGYMEDRMLLDNVTEAYYRSMEEKSKKEGKVYDLEHFFR